MRVFIAGALSSKESTERAPSQVVVDYLANVNKMCRAASIVRKAGHAPFVPALDLLLGVINGDWAEEEYRGTSVEFLKVCDAVIVISMSWGVHEELDVATELGIPVFYELEALFRYLELKQGKEKK